MSGTWTDPLGVPRDPNVPTDDADIYQGDPGDTGLVFVPSAGAGDDTLYGGGGFHLMGGGEGNDLIFAGPDGNELYGNEGDDTLVGGDGGDLLNGGFGDDSIVGGGGPDTYGVVGDPSEYTWSALPGGGWIVTDTVVGRGGADTIGGDVEYIYYASPGIEHSIPCFVEGTRIMTRGGELPVEALRVGDLVLALGPGGVRYEPIRWIGHRHVDLARHPDPEAARAIRIRAGAFGPGVPSRDLLVSPDHALFLDGVLVAAGLLVNGDTIAPAHGVRRFRYFHVELDRHAVLLAEGAAAESYLEDGNRMQFDNGAIVVALHPGFRPARPASGGAAESCVPRLFDGPRLEALRARHGGDGARGGITARQPVFGRR